MKELQAIWYKKLKDSGFKDIENDKNDKLSQYPLYWTRFNGNFIQNRLDQQSFYRVIGLYIHHAENVPTEHKKCLESYIVTGDMPLALKQSKAKVSLAAMYKYVKRNFPKMLSFVNKMEDIE